MEKPLEIMESKCYPPLALDVALRASTLCVRPPGDGGSGAALGGLFGARGPLGRDHPNSHLDPPWCNSQPFPMSRVC